MEYVILVDKNDREIGTMEKLAAHREAVLHRAFSIFILRRCPRGTELLLQRRQWDKYHCGGLWTNSCCSHPRPGETVLAAADRRLFEELGFRTRLREIGSFIYRAPLDRQLVEHELDHVLVGTYNGRAIVPNPEEVAEYRWVEIESLWKELSMRKNDFTPWFAKAFALVMNAAKPDLTGCGSGAELCLDGHEVG